MTAYKIHIPAGLMEQVMEIDADCKQDAKNKFFEEHVKSMSESLKKRVRVVKK